MDYALKLQNRTCQLVYKLNGMGVDGYGTEHRLGSREMDMISRFAGSLVDEERAFIERRLAMVGIDLKAEMERAQKIYTKEFFARDEA